MTIWILHTLLTETQENHLLQTRRITPGWPELPSLFTVTSEQEIRQMLQVAHPESTPESRQRQASHLWNFLSHMLPDDMVGFVLPASKRIRFGRVTGSYLYDDGAELPHSRLVEWVGETTALADWKDVLGAGEHYPGCYLLEQKQESAVKNRISTGGRKRYKIATWLFTAMLLLNLIALLLSNFHRF